MAVKVKAKPKTIDDIRDLFKGTLKEGTIFEAIKVLNDDPDFHKLPFLEQMNYLGLFVRDIRLENRYERLKKKSLISDAAATVYNVEKLSSDNSLQVSEVDYIINALLSEECRFLIVSGPTGVGKTSFGSSIIDMVLRRGFPAIYKQYSLEMYYLTSLYKSHTTYAERLLSLVKCKVLMLDDFILNSHQDFELDCLKELIDCAMANKTSIILSSQVMPDDWYKELARLNSSPNAKLQIDAIIDRIFADPIIVKMSGESKRGLNKTGKVFNAKSNLGGSNGK